MLNKLGQELDLRIARNELIASNVANVDTPGYKSKDLQFQRMLTENIERIKLKTSHPLHLEEMSKIGDPGKVVEDPNPGRVDGNNVNIDAEMLKLTENNIKYNIVVNFLKKKIDGLKKAIEEHDIPKNLKSYNLKSKEVLSRYTIENEKMLSSYNQLIEDLFKGVSKERNYDWKENVTT